MQTRPSSLKCNEGRSATMWATVIESGNVIKRNRKMNKNKNDNKNDDIDLQWMTPEAYIYLSKQADKEGKEEITDDDFRQYLLSGKWKK